MNTGDSVQLNCYVSKGDTPLNISWLLNNKEIKNIFGSSTIPIGTRTNLLTINSVQPEHAGLYTCRALNVGGEARHSTELFINGTICIENLYCFLFYVHMYYFYSYDALAHI